MNQLLWLLRYCLGIALDSPYLYQYQFMPNLTPRPTHPDDQPDDAWIDFLAIPDNCRTLLESRRIVLSVIETDSLAAVVLSCPEDLPTHSVPVLSELATAIYNSTRIPLCVLRSPQQMIKISLAGNGDRKAVRVDYFD